jgi:hypothetical protein
METLLRVLKAAIEGQFTSGEWQAWCDYHAPVLREHMSANRFLRLKWCPSREAARLLDEYGVKYKRPRYRYEECHFCGARLLHAVPGETTAVDIVLFARRCSLPDAHEIEQSGWIHPGVYCPNGCIEIFDHYKRDTAGATQISDNPNPTVVVTPNAVNWVKCPCCGKRFSLDSAASWDGKQHTTCGQRLLINSP